MEQDLFKTIISQGAWAVLFVWLLIDTRKESKTREEKMREESKEREERLQVVINKNQEVISELAEKFDVVEDIKVDVEEIKTNMKGRSM